MKTDDYCFGNGYGNGFGDGYSNGDGDGDDTGYGDGDGYSFNDTGDSAEPDSTPRTEVALEN